MRPIKFRAWDKKRMVLWHQFWPNWEDVNKEDSEIILMQFTGLKDKNGKEIWESDIVQEVYKGTVFEHVILWSDVNSGFWLGTTRHLNKGTAEQIKVIGNIYENKKG